MNDNIYNTIILGALLHDIGKFIQRAEDWTKKTIGKHQNLSAIFVNPENVQQSDLTIDIPENWISKKKY